MTDDDKVALKEFMRGAAFTLAIVGIAIIGIAMLSPDNTPIQEQSTEVVGKYKECDPLLYGFNTSFLRRL